MRRSSRGQAARKRRSRGSSQRAPNEGRTLTQSRAGRRSIARAASSMRPKASRAVAASASPAGVRRNDRGSLWNRRTPSSSSRFRTWWLTADCVTCSSRPASVRLEWRAAASKARSAFREGSSMDEIFSCLARESIACAAGEGQRRSRQEAAMLRLYDNLVSGNAYKVRLILRLLGIPFERVEVDIVRGESRTPEFLAKNPEGRIPVLRLEDGTHLFESNAIVCYLAEGTPYLPEGRLARAQALQWMFWEQDSHEPNGATGRHWVAHIGVPEEKRALLEQKRALGARALSVMERHLEGRTYLAADRFTVADIALYAYTHVAPEGGFDLAPFSRLRSWLDRVRDRPGFTPITQS